MSTVCESWSLEDLTRMRDADMEKLLGFYESGNVPPPEQIWEDPDLTKAGFDGSFGWSL